MISIEEWLSSLIPSLNWWPLTGYGTFLLAMIFVGVLSIIAARAEIAIQKIKGEENEKKRTSF